MTSGLSGSPAWTGSADMTRAYAPGTKRPADSPERHARVTRSHAEWAVSGARPNRPSNSKELPRLLQRVMPPLRRGPDIFGAGLLPSAASTRGQRRRAPRGQVPLGPARAAEGDPQPQVTAAESVIWVITAVAAAALVHLLGQAAQPRQVRAAAGRAGQDLIGVPALRLGQPAGPCADQPGPRRRQLPCGQRLPDHRVRGQPPGPADRTGGGTGGDPGLPPQPGPRRAVPVVLEPALPGERRQHPAPGAGVLGLRALQRP